ncbi:hypothetical protein [uncultured Ramlibacter sp.]|uniref:hypothetical protein n=1 Tax=uncultured Ramlibacter sp. TaxID=260755 RepID=UPI002619D452|nr:hypothetical protein [uncultured Ramlibacter sp.]
MGWFMQEHDIYIGSMLDELNVRFAPTQKGAANHGGIREMIELQTEFKLFKKGRSFRTSVTALNLSAWNHDVKNRWYDLVGALAKHDSNVRGQNGDVAIVSALVKNLASKTPLPVYFTSHDMRGDKENAQVKIFDKSRPIHYLEQDYLTISLPMQPVKAAKAANTAKAAAKSKAKPATKK